MIYVVWFLPGRLLLLMRQLHIVRNEIAQQQDTANNGTDDDGEPEFIGAGIQRPHEQEGQHYQQQRSCKE